MLVRTKKVVEDFKKAGFERKDFSARTKQDNKNGGWKDTDIHINKIKIEKKLFGEDYLLEDERELGNKLQHYMRKRFKNLVHNKTNKNYRITEWQNSKGLIWYTISTIYNKSKFQVHVGYEKYEDMKLARFYTITKEGGE